LMETSLFIDVFDYLCFMDDLFAKMDRKLETMIMDEHHILFGETTMILMSTFGEISATIYV
jgi:hypothetical protein